MATHATNTQPHQTEQTSAVLKLLSFNIQVGIDTLKFSDYFRKGWRHVLPHSGRHLNLMRIAHLIQQYDIVALQEVDAGSLRSSYINQVQYLAERAQFPFWHLQQNRKLAHIAAHANGLLSKFPTEMIIDHSLPGRVPGRGALQASFGHSEQTLAVFVVHLALGKKSQEKQLNYLAESVANKQHFVIMGDLNCSAESLITALASRGIKSQAPSANMATYPSWSPKKCIDHIVISDSLKIRSFGVLPNVISDHLPVTLEIELPPELNLHMSDRAEDKIENSHLVVENPTKLNRWIKRLTKN